LSYDAAGRRPATHSNRQQSLAWAGQTQQDAVAYSFGRQVQTAGGICCRLYIYESFIRH